MQVEVFEELVDWFNENVLDETDSLPEQMIADEAETQAPRETTTLDENAQIYTWCPHRKRLVRSD